MAAIESTTITITLIVPATTPLERIAQSASVLAWGLGGRVTQRSEKMGYEINAMPLAEVVPIHPERRPLDAVLQDGGGES